MPEVSHINTYNVFNPHSSMKQVCKMRRILYKTNIWNARSKFQTIWVSLLAAHYTKHTLFFFITFYIEIRLRSQMLKSSLLRLKSPMNTP